MKAIIVGLLTIMLSLALGRAWASSLTVPNTFTADTPAKAEEVNANFAAVKSATDDNDSRITALETAVKTLQDTVTSQAKTITTLQSQMSAVNNSNVMALDPYVSVLSQGDSKGANGPIVRFTKVNVQIVNGMGSTYTVNGLGNLIIGYDEQDVSTNYHCTIGVVATTGAPATDSASCKSAGGSWTNSGFKSGSHYLIVGSENNYSGFGGIVSGFQNTSNYNYANVTAGMGNTASGLASSVSGGEFNFAFAGYSSVSGGENNQARGLYSSVSGGEYNYAIGEYSSVSGGDLNTAGYGTGGTASSVSDGKGHAVDSDYNWAAGGLFESQ